MQLRSARKAQKTRSESKHIMNYSKCWNPGDTIRGFVPIYKDEDDTWQIAVGDIWGHKVGDFKTLGLKTTFIPSLTEFDEETGFPVGTPDVTYQFSKIAPIFVQGMKRNKIAQCEAKKWPNEDLKKEQLKEIEAEFDTKNNLKAIKPIISKASYFISTECLSLKLVNDQPKVDTIGCYSLPLSDQTITELYTILETTKYAPEDGDEFLEFEITYPTETDKQKSSRGAHYNGVTSEYRLKTQFPEAYKLVAAQFPLVARDRESIVRRCTTKINEAKIRNALTQYSILYSENLDIASEQDVEILVKNAPIIKELGVLSSMSETSIIEKIEAELRRLEVETPVPAAMPDLAAAAQVPATESEPAPVTSTVTEESAPTVPEEDLNNPAAPKLTELLNNSESRAEMSDEELMNIDLGQI